jgi:Cu/Ag efflux pump CusA
MIGAAVILADPIFQGLAISLVFGLASSTALTVLVIPAICVLQGGRQGGDQAATVLQEAQSSVPGVKQVAADTTRLAD